jgi:hypothetical protein
MNNFISFCNDLLNVGGVVIITCLSGEKIFNKVITTGLYELYENNILKFSIKKIFNDTTFEKSGQRIEVLLPFSNGKYYTEFLVNLNTLKEEFCKKAFTTEYEMCMIDMLDHFKEINRTVYDKLNEIDKEYIDLFSAIVFKKTI